MSNTKPKFNGKDLRHRMQMLQLIHALALEINTGLVMKVNFFHHAKALGWVDEKTRTRKMALAQLVKLAQKGFGYVAKDRIKLAMRPPVKVNRKAKAA